MGVLDDLMQQFAPPVDPRIEAIDNMTRLQQDLHKRLGRGETLSEDDTRNYLNRSYPPEYKGLPEQADDIFGY